MASINVKDDDECLSLGKNAKRSSTIILIIIIISLIILIATIAYEQRPATVTKNAAGQQDAQTKEVDTGKAEYKKTWITRLVMASAGMILLSTLVGIWNSISVSKLATCKSSPDNRMR